MTTNGRNEAITVRSENTKNNILVMELDGTCERFFNENKNTNRFYRGHKIKV